MSRKLATKATIARLHGVTSRSITNWHIAGHIVGYRVAGQSALLYDVDEVRAEVARNPHMRTPDKVHRGPVVVLNEPVSVLPEYAP